MVKKITLALLSLLLVPLGMMAQNVTVHPGNGNMLPALKAGNKDKFFEWNGYATWKHEQLSLTLTTGDSDNNSGTDADGNLARPANDIFKSADAKCLQIGKGGIDGNVMDTYVTVVLPKGYRFTGYTITFHRIKQPNGASGTISNTSASISFGETDNTFDYTSTTNTTTQNVTPYCGGIGQNNSNQYTIGRTSQNATEMGNVLYFKLSAGNNSGRAFIQLDRVEFLFTAENNYTPLIPAPNVVERSAVDIPFTTSKMDYGELKRYNINGQEVQTGGRVSYDGTIHDMNANLILYENGSTETITAAQNDFDGTAGDRVKYQSGSISQAGDYFKLDASKHRQKDKPISETGATNQGEVIYYIESPVWATNSASTTAHKNPIGYRIIGAEFECIGGDVKFPAVFKIQYESTGHSADQNGTYGLNFYENSLAYNWNYQTEWRIDDDGYIYSGNSYLTVAEASGWPSYAGYDYTLTTTTDKSQAFKFEITSDNQIRLKDYTSYYIGWYESTWNGITRYVVLTTNTNTNDRATYKELSHAFEETIGQYTFNIYDKTGTSVEKTVTVNGNSGTLSIDGLNNDAIKIGVIGTGVVKGRVIMQALDPYIERMDIVCQEEGGNGGKLTQQFNATDFSVRGGAFDFYVPEDFKAPAKFTFENLYSKFGDETYPDGKSSNHARYSFVWSPYFQWISKHGKNVYNTDPDHTYADKIHTEKPGLVPFTFNNAATATNTTGTQFEEYPFNPGEYGEDNFDYFTFTQDEMNGESPKTAYLFTCDETRYNIAPTTATQHTAYAFYKMTITMKKHTYDPILVWEKVYDKTFYSANNSDIKRDSKWGLKLSTTPITDDQGTHSGYLTVSRILDKIAKRTGDNTVAGGPKTTDQILYIDASNLMSIVENQTVKVDENGNPVVVDDKTQYVSHPTSELMEELGENALIYLPYGAQSSNNNFAFNTVAQYNETPSFRGANNIVIKDRYPFYAPYDIQVVTAKMAQYERTVTNPTLYGDDDQHLTIVLPFEINLTNGTHTNSDGSSFTLATMNSTDALSKNEDSDAPVNYGTGHFATLTTEKKSEANKPYLVTMPGTAGESAFKVHVNGALVKATPDKSGFLVGEDATGKYTDGEGKTSTYTFKHQGTYMGVEIGTNGGAAKSDTTVFYFANNYFLDSKTLTKAKSLKMLPFRSYYDYEVKGDATLARFNIVFGENDDDDITGINAVRKNSNLAIIPGDGYITIMAKADSNVAIHTVNGMTVEKCNLRAGEIRTVAVPSGIYVINGVKMVVK